jgi:hypothetical protein
MRIGKEEEKILEYLQNHNGSEWLGKLENSFSHTVGYKIVMHKRIKTLEKKGLVKIVWEKNSETGRLKKKVYLAT